MGGLIMPDSTQAAEAAFDAYFAGRARFFLPRELRCLGASNALGGRAAGLNRLPPEALWPNILPTLDAADAIRDLFGAPLRVLSAYRSAAYNRKVGGAKDSYHLRYMALDLAPVSAKPSEVARLYGCAVILRNKGLLRGGLGRYSWGIHIDCGPSREW